MRQLKKFAFDVGWVLFSSLIALLLAFLRRVILARWLGAADLGLFTMVLTIQEMATFVASLGIPIAFTKYVAQYQDDKDMLYQNSSAAFISSLVFGLVVGIILFALSGILAGVFHMPELKQLLRILAFVFPFAAVFEALLGLFNGLRQMSIYAYLMILRNFVMLISIVALLWLGFGIEGAVEGIVISVIGGCILGLFFSRKLLRLNLRGFTLAIKKLVSFGSQVFVADALGLIILHIDVIMIGYFMADEDVGYYSIAVSLSTFFLMVPSAIQRITYPATSQYWAQNNHSGLRQMIDKSMKYSACILLPFGLGVGFFAREIITLLFGQEFILAVLSLWILMIARIIVGSTSNPVGASMTGIGRPDIALKLSALSCVLNVILNAILIPRYGIAGAAVATAVSLLVRVVIYLALMPRILGTSIDIKWYARALGLSCVAIALYVIGARFINHYVAGGIIFCGFIILVFEVFLTKEDRAKLGSLAFSSIRRS